MSHYKARNHNGLFKTGLINVLKRCGLKGVNLNISGERGPNEKVIKAFSRIVFLKKVK